MDANNYPFIYLADVESNCLNHISHKHFTTMPICIYLKTISSKFIIGFKTN